jgi:hypothetical protein
MQHVVQALIAKRAEIAGIIGDLERKLAQYRADLVHIDSTIAMFDPTIITDTIKPKRPVPARSGYFGHGEMTRRCREALRDAEEPIWADDMAAKIMADKGLDPDDRKLRSDFIVRVLWAMKRLRKAGTVQQIGSGLGSRWVLSDR